VISSDVLRHVSTSDLVFLIHLRHKVREGDEVSTEDAHRAQKIMNKLDKRNKK